MVVLADSFIIITEDFITLSYNSLPCFLPELSRFRLKSGLLTLAYYSGIIFGKSRFFGFFLLSGECCVARSPFRVLELIENFGKISKPAAHSNITCST